MPGYREKRHKSRELRRSVMLPARMRTNLGWSDACVLNISTRGLLVHARVPVVEGSVVEVRHRDYSIVAKVMWRDGRRAGLQAEHMVPVDDILVLSGTAGPQVTVGRVRHERRPQPRSHEHSRLQGRAFEFASAVIIAVSLATGAFSMVERAFARPLAYVSGALGG